MTNYLQKDNPKCIRYSLYRSKEQCVVSKRDLIVVLTDVEKELAIRSQFEALEVVSKYKGRFLEDLKKTHSNPEFPMHSVIYEIIMRLLENK